MDKLAATDSSEIICKINCAQYLRLNLIERRGAGSTVDRRASARL